jgi:rare lipoprotein A (peptidoglycan hydrolase)
MEIKTTLRFHLTPVRMAKIKKKKQTQVTADAGEIVGKEEHSSTADGIASWYNDFGNQFDDSSENWT